MSADSQFRALVAMMDASGVAWSEIVRAIVAARPAGMDARTSLGALAEEFQRRAGPADDELAREQARAVALLRKADPADPLRTELMEMVLAFGEQREGLRLLVDAFNGGETVRLEEAQKRVAQGMERARAATARANRTAV